jgi:hypothetical protein
MILGILYSAIGRYAGCHYVCYAECHYAEFHHADCRGASEPTFSQPVLFLIISQLSFFIMVRGYKTFFVEFSTLWNKLERFQLTKIFHPGVVFDGKAKKGPTTLSIAQRDN